VDSWLVNYWLNGYLYRGQYWYKKLLGALVSRVMLLWDYLFVGGYLVSIDKQFDIQRAAVLIMDFQEDIVGTVARNPGKVVDRASSVLSSARVNGIPVIYVVHHGGRFAEASPGRDIHHDLLPTPDEPVLIKTKTSPFSTTGIDVLLRQLRVDTLILLGVATSGCVLSTVRWAFDLEYKLIVVEDACDDADEQVHALLTQKIYPRQSNVVTADELHRMITRK
jgi:nicotinamidase-related amidase